MRRDGADRQTVRAKQRGKIVIDDSLPVRLALCEFTDRQIALHSTSTPVPSVTSGPPSVARGFGEMRPMIVVTGCDGCIGAGVFVMARGDQFMGMEFIMLGASDEVPVGVGVFMVARGHGQVGMVSTALRPGCDDSVRMSMVSRGPG